jgi:hypothetical protein
MKAIKITVDERLLARLDADPEVKKSGRSAVFRHAVEAYLLEQRKRRIAAGAKRARPLPASVSEPALIHNSSGVGSSFDVVDLNKDGKQDIVTATVFGTYVFWGKPAAAPAARK